MGAKRFSRLLTLCLIVALARPFVVFAQAAPAAEPSHHHYKLIGMGTFGGPASSINSPFSQGTLNNRGMAVGWSATAVAFITHTFEWNGSVQDLSALPPSETNCSEPFFMNSKGEVEIKKLLVGNVNDRGEILAKAAPLGFIPNDDADLGHLALLVPCDPDTQDCSAVLQPANQAASPTLAMHEKTSASTLRNGVTTWHKLMGRQSEP